MYGLKYKKRKKKWERKYEKCRNQRRLYQIKQNKKKNQQKYIKRTHKIEVWKRKVYLSKKM
jgi:hypothetical protein